MSVLDKLTEGIVNRDLQKEGAALLNKWENTGLLEGLNSDQSKDAMARLLENQAKELLREASSMATGDVEGFAGGNKKNKESLIREEEDEMIEEVLNYLLSSSGE